MSRTISTLAISLVLTLIPSLALADECGLEDEYPTATIADYVLGCMAANGNSYEALHQCSCSIDYIRERFSYADYERTQTVMQVQQDRGQRGLFYRDSKWAKSKVEVLQKIQAESTLSASSSYHRACSSGLNTLGQQDGGSVALFQNKIVDVARLFAHRSPQIVRELLNDRIGCF